MDFNLFRWLIPVRLDQSRVEQEINEVKSKIAASEKGISDSLKKSFGGESGFGKLGGLLAGGGLVGGVTLLARALTNLSDQMHQANVEVAEGNLTTREWLGQILRAIPVLGDFIKLFDSLDALTGGVGNKELINNQKLAESQNKAADMLESLTKLRRVIGKEGLERELENINMQEEEFLRQLSQVPNAMRQIVGDSITLTFEMMRQSEIQDDHLEKLDKELKFRIEIANRIREAAEEEQRILDVQDRFAFNERRREQGFGRSFADFNKRRDDAKFQVQLLGLNSNLPEDRLAGEELRARKEYKDTIREIARQEEDLQNQIEDTQRARIEDAKQFAEGLPEEFREQFLAKMRKQFEEEAEAARARVSQSSYEVKKWANNVLQATIAIAKQNAALEKIQEIPDQLQGFSSGVARGLGERVSLRPETPELRELRKVNDNLIALVREMRRQVRGLGLQP